MRFLKMKIARAQEYSLKNQDTTKEFQKLESIAMPLQSVSTSPKKQVKVHSEPSVMTSPTDTSGYRGWTSYKNIIKNYSKALTRFAISELALPYLKEIAAKFSVDLQAFRKFILPRRSKINCIKNLREMLLAQKGDNEQIIAMKNVFQEISIVFMKQYSVNWIFHSKISDKMVHLMARFKVLRRIERPTYFTYMEEFSKKNANRVNGGKTKF